MKIKTKLISSLLAISLPALIFTNIFFYFSEKTNLTNQILNHLESVASIQQSRIKSMIFQNLERLRLVSSRTQLRLSLEKFIADGDYKHQVRMTRILNDAKSSINGFMNICILTIDGTVIVSTDNERIGRNYSKRDCFIHGKKKYSADQFFIDKDQNLNVCLSGPLYMNNKLLGILVIEASVENIISSVSDYTGLGKSGETVLAKRNANKDVLFIMPTRFDQHAALNLTIPKDRRHIPITQSFQPTHNIFTETVDYRGVSVLAATRYVEETDWGIVVKIDKAEALAPVNQIRNLLVIILVASIIVVILISHYISKGITRPILKVTDVAKSISEGDLTAKADETNQDETGILASSFNKMTINLIATQNALAVKVEELQEKEERIRLILDSTAEAIYGMDINGNCTFCNPSCLKILGYKEDIELLGQHMHTLIHHTKANGTEHSVKECKICQGLQKKKEVYADDELFWRADGTSFWTEYRSYPVIKDHKTLGSVVAFWDIGERKAALEEKKKLNFQLQQAQKMEAIGELAGGIAHDFNNILSAILGYAELAKIKSHKNSEIVDYLLEVLKAGNRAKDLVKQILTFSRQAEQERVPVKIHSIVKEAVKLLRASIPSTIEIKEKIDSYNETVLADPTQIHQVLMNLCTNAYHAMREKGGVLSVKLSRTEITKYDEKASGLNLAPGLYVKLAVSDTGHGMNPATLERIFEPYFTTKMRGDGTGMGLSIVHGIIKNHNGHITVYSEPGKGTTFQVYLPQISNTHKGLGADTANVLPLGNERILVVDDEETIANIEKHMLRGLGYQVTAFTNCDDVLYAFSSNPEMFDLIITDMTMPSMTGIELAQKLWAVRPDVPIILCTGFSDLINEKEAKAIGIRDYIMKPFSLKEMAKVVRKALDV